jgi:hypothetical protein
LRPESCWRSRLVSSSVPLRAAATAPIDGCDVRPDIESIATSTMSAPALAAATIVATEAPAVSCEWMWIGMSGSSLRIAPTRSSAACGVRRPAMSLIAIECTPGGEGKR